MTEEASATDRPITVPGAISVFLTYAADTMELLDLVRSGARSLVGINRGLAAANQVIRDEPSGHDAARMERVAQAATVANSEIARDFPMLHNHALMGLWGALEATMDDVCVAWASERTEVLQEAPFQNIRVSAAKILALSATDQVRMLIEEVKRDQATAFKVGVGQFEALLSAIGLSGEIDDNVRNVFRITKAIRNVVAHRGGIADSRFLDVCPDLAIALGSSVAITSAQMMAIVAAMVMYVDTVHDRARVA